MHLSRRCCHEGHRPGLSLWQIGTSPNHQSLHVEIFFGPVLFRQSAYPRHSNFLHNVFFIPVPQVVEVLVV